MAVRFRLRVLIWKPSRHLQSSSPERGGSDNQVHQGTFSDAAQRVNAYQTMIAACTEWNTISTGSHNKRYNKAMGFPAIRCEKDIEDIVGVSRAAVSAILDKMERAALIIRRSSAYDKRMKRVSLSEQGVAAAHDVYKTMCSIEDEICSCLTDGEMETIFTVKSKLVSKLEELGC